SRESRAGGDREESAPAGNHAAGIGSTLRFGGRACVGESDSAVLSRRSLSEDGRGSEGASGIPEDHGAPGSRSSQPFLSSGATRLGSSLRAAKRHRPRAYRISGFFCHMERRRSRCASPPTSQGGVREAAVVPCPAGRFHCPEVVCL